MRKISPVDARIASSQITPYETYLSRRALLAGAVGIAAAGRFGGAARAAVPALGALVIHARREVQRGGPAEYLRGHRHLQQLL